jgi:hypothetical protein
LSPCPVAPPVSSRILPYQFPIVLAAAWSAPVPLAPRSGALLVDSLPIDPNQIPHPTRAACRRDSFKSLPPTHNATGDESIWYAPPYPSSPLLQLDLLPPLVCLSPGDSRGSTAAGSEKALEAKQRGGTREQR